MLPPFTRTGLPEPRRFEAGHYLQAVTLMSATKTEVPPEEHLQNPSSDVVAPMSFPSDSAHTAQHP